jgi:hypothetical protein
MGSVAKKKPSGYEPEEAQRQNEPISGLKLTLAQFTVDRWSNHLVVRGSPPGKT